MVLELKKIKYLLVRGYPLMMSTLRGAG